MAARFLDPRQQPIRTQNPNAAAGQAAVQKLAGAYGTPQVTGPGANAFDAAQPVTPTATPGPHISDSPYGMGADFLGTGGPMVTSDPAEVNRMQGKAATPQEAEANRRAKEAAAQAPGYQPGVVDSVNPNPLLDPLRDAKNYYYDARNFMNPDGTVNKLREASAYSEYGAAERFNPLLAEQEANLGEIATAAGEFARDSGAQTAATAGSVSDTATAMQTDFLGEANAPRRDIDVMSGDAAGQQSTTLGRLRSFNAASGGASAAEVSARNQSNRDFANSLAIARSGGTASQRAWAERAAVAQNFERQAEVGRNLVAERAAEAERSKQRELAALQTEAGAAGGVDTTRLGLATTEADVDLRLQELADRYGVDMSQLGAQTYLQGQQLAGQLDAQAFNQQMTGYQLPYQAQQDIIAQGNFQQQLGAQNYGLAQGLDIQAQQLADQRAALPWQIGAGLVGGLGSAGLMALKSDIRAKTDVAPTAAGFDPMRGVEAGQRAALAAESGARWSQSERRDDDDTYELGAKMLAGNLSGILSNIGGAVSDRGAKSVLARLRDDAAAHAVEESPGYTYRYKPGLGEPTNITFVGPMANDLEGTEFGASLVDKGPDGYKRINTERLALLDHAALGSVLERLRRLEDAA